MISGGNCVISTTFGLARNGTRYKPSLKAPAGIESRLQLEASVAAKLDDIVADITNLVDNLRKVGPIPTPPVTKVQSDAIVGIWLADSTYQHSFVCVQSRLMDARLLFRGPHIIHRRASRH